MGLLSCVRLRWEQVRANWLPLLVLSSVLVSLSVNRLIIRYMMYVRN